MRAIIIGARRGSRLMPTTADTPKCFAEVQGKRILDWTVEAFRENNVDDITFIGGYRIEAVRDAYPDFTFRHNTDWENNNILASLFYAEDLMHEPFMCCYSDILFTRQIVADMMGSEADISLAVDTEWLVRYEHRSEHPSDDAEKVTVENGRVTEIERQIPEQNAYGEYIGLAKFSTAGGAALKERYHLRRNESAGQPFRSAKVFERAYLIHLLQDMIESNHTMAHVDTPGGYIEVDTQQDFEYARAHWMSRHSHK